MKIVILAGGSGTRLWPLSRNKFPKQFLKLGQDYSLLQKTILRFLKAFKPQDLVIVTQKETADLVKSQASAIAPALKERIIVEPVRRNTAPAILFALKWLEERNELDSCFLVTPADQLISPESTFLKQVVLAQTVAEKGHHVTFGVSPTYPHTGYGYILCDPEKPVSDVVKFIEKPTLEFAQELLAEGNCLWNAGIFVFQTKAFLNELKEHQSQMSKAYAGNITEEFSTLPNLSIDYAFMEYSKKLKVIPLNLSWSDVGSWDNIYEVLDKDQNNNVKEGNVVTLDTKNSLIFGGERLIATLGVEELLIVDTPDALLVAKKGTSQQIRLLVEKLKEKKVKQLDEHSTVYRPWGSYTILEEGMGYKIKRIAVEPGQKLSLQYHLHRSEHWVVIAGEAKITRGDKEMILKENESIFVPKQTIHRLENLRDTLLEIIEVQVGEYVGEDDIVRLEDIYDRMASKV